MVESGVDTVVMEVSSHALSLGRVDGIGFALGGFTNLSRDHLDFHPTMEDYFEAKARLFDVRSRNHAAAAVVCVDDDAGAAMARRAEKVTTVSATGAPADWQARDIAAIGAGAQRFTLVDPSGVPHELQIGLTGGYNIANAALAVALLDQSRGAARPGGAGAAYGDRAGPAAADRPGAAFPWRWSITHTSPVPCRPCWRPCGRACRRRRVPVHAGPRRIACGVRCRR